MWCSGSGVRNGWKDGWFGCRGRCGRELFVRSNASESRSQDSFNHKLLSRKTRLVWAWVSPPRGTRGTWHVSPTIFGRLTMLTSRPIRSSTELNFLVSKIFRLSVFSSTEFCIHTSIDNVGSISQCTPQFRSNSASCNTFQWLLACFHGSIPPN